MPTKSLPFILAALIVLCGISEAVSINVPKESEMLDACDTIVVARFTTTSIPVRVEIAEVLKGAPELKGQVCTIDTPYSPMSFPLEKWARESGRADVILLGKWNVQSRTLNPIYGTSSIWPRGCPIDVGRNPTLADCKSKIETHQQSAYKSIDSPLKKWKNINDSLLPVFPSIRVQQGKLLLRPINGVRLLYSTDEGAKKLTSLDEEISLKKGQRLRVYERHTQTEFIPIDAEGKARFAVVVREDLRSFGAEFSVSTSVFDLGENELLPVPEPEAKAALKAAREKR